LILIVRGLIATFNGVLAAAMSDESDELLKRFGECVRELRKAKGYSQEGFAAHCGLDRTYVGGIERGERNVSLRNINVIAKALEIPISTLLRDVDSK